MLATFVQKRKFMMTREEILSIVRIWQMTIIKSNGMKEFYNKAIDNLKIYVSEANPIVNHWLRSDMDASEYTFDSLFYEGVIIQPLYRWINNAHIQIQDGIFADKGYLSGTSDFDSFINHVEGEHIACLQFDIPDSFERIDVCSLLPNYNDESEIILPRGLQFRVEEIQTYSTYSEIDDFLNNVGSYSSAKEICDIYGIKRITYYRLSLIRH